MSDWTKHLNGLASLESNVGKKVAFESSAEMIDNLDKENKQLKQRIEQLECERDRYECQALVLMGRYGDNWYDGYLAAWNEQRSSQFGGIDDHSEDDILKMSEHAESEYLSKAMSNEPEKVINKRDIEQQRNLLSRINKLTVAKCNELDIYHPEWLLEIFVVLRNELAEQPCEPTKSTCEHNWVSAKNEHIKNGSFCTKCHAISEFEPEQLRKGGEL